MSESFRQLLRALPDFPEALPDFDPASAPADPAELFRLWLDEALARRRAAAQRLQPGHRRRARPAVRRGC